MQNTRSLIGALAVVAIGAGISACAPSAMPSAGQKPGGPSAAAPGSIMGSGMPDGGSAVTSAPGAGGGISTGPGSYILQSMPAGTVSFSRGPDGHLSAHVTMFGLTPGSSHDVTIDGPGFGRGPGGVRAVVRFPVLTADPAGQVNTTLTSAGHVRALPPLSRFVIRLGSTGGTPAAGALAAEPIAESAALPPRPLSSRPGPAGVFAFHAVTSNADGVTVGRPSGRATITYDAAAQTLTVSVTAYGLNPGPHAAHIHLGSCQSQGAVKYMLADFTADGNGDIIDQTRVVTGVTSVPGPGNWYLNLHQGGMNQILSNGVPTLSFRPMLCANISSFATAGGQPPSMASSPSPSAPMAMASSPSAPATQGATPSSSPSATPDGGPSVSPSAIATGQPRHW